MITIEQLRPDSPELELCARWRADAFSVLDRTAEDERRTLATFLAGGRDRAGLIAKRDGVAAGTCLLVPSEIDPLHDVTPWLAGLYVTPEHRRFGIGAKLVRSIEDEARERGHAHVYLYTGRAVAFYQRLGWSVADRVAWKGIQTSLMKRDVL